MIILQIFTYLHWIQKSVSSVSLKDIHDWWFFLTFIEKQSIKLIITTIWLNARLNILNIRIVPPHNINTTDTNEHICGSFIPFDKEMSRFVLTSQICRLGVIKLVISYYI